jgi:membrane fusion protein (multidrug efflux system)
MSGDNGLRKVVNVIERVRSHEKVRRLEIQIIALYRQALVWLRETPVLAPVREKLLPWIIARRKRLIPAAVAVVVLIVVANLVFPLRLGMRRNKRVVRTDVFVVEPVDYTDSLTAMGLIRGSESVDLGFQVSGVVKSVHFDEGIMVNKGDIIATLDDTDARLKVEFNESKVNAAQKRLEVHEELFKLKSIIEAKLDEIRYELDSQKKELEFARQELIKTRLVAPVSGLLGPLEVEPGESVNPNTKVTSLFGVGTVYADLGVIEKDIGRVKRGQTVNVSVDAYPDQVRTGTLASVSPVIEGRSRNFKVRASIMNDDPAALFLPGMFVRAAIRVYEAKSALILPRTAVKDDAVYVLDEKNTARVRSVTIGYRSYDHVEVTSGLESGDRIVAELEGDLSDEPKVEVINERRFEENA